MEALACGRPVIGLAKGGVTETVVDGKTGVLVEDLTADAFAAGIERASSIPFDPSVVRERSLRFSLERFQHDMRVLIEETAAQRPRPEEPAAW